MFSLKINKWGGPNKVWGGRKKIEKLISRGGDVYQAPESIVAKLLQSQIMNVIKVHTEIKLSITEL